MFSGGSMQSNYSCGACSQAYTVVQNLGDENNTTIQGAQWCFQGPHSTVALPTSDRRRVYPNTVSLVAGPDLQSQLDAIPEDTETLTVTSGGMYDDSSSFTLDKRLPNLKKLQLVDVSWSRVRLDEATTPQLRSLRLQNVPNECELVLALPQLRDVTVHFWGGGDEPINAMLEAATQLESFDSYKLWVEELNFASNHLLSVDVHRSDSLERMTLWAPNLQRLGLQACFGLQDLAFLPTHALAAALPEGYVCTNPLEVNTTNANLGQGARRAIREHPRTVKSRAAHQGMPTEGMFAGMHAGMQGISGVGDWDDYEDDDVDD
jgi:hypothetical protein